MWSSVLNEDHMIDSFSHWKHLYNCEFQKTVDSWYHPFHLKCLIILFLLQEPRKKVKESRSSNLKRKGIESDEESPPRKTVHRRKAVVYDSDEDWGLNICLGDFSAIQIYMLYYTKSHTKSQMRPKDFRSSLKNLQWLIQNWNSTSIAFVITRLGEWYNVYPNALCLSTTNYWGLNMGTLGSPELLH